MIKQIKRCRNPKCGKYKAISEFYMNGDRRASQCKECIKKQVMDRARTRLGLAGVIYARQHTFSKKRGHPPPNYTLKEFRLWLFDCLLFEELYLAWVKSGYDKMTIPSVDRLDDSKPYSLDNIQIMTWRENKQKAHRDMREGKIIHGTKPHKAIVHLVLHSDEIIEYPSVREASRLFGKSASHISHTCNGNHKAYGDLWYFKEDYNG